MAAKMTSKFSSLVLGLAVIGLALPGAATPSRAQEDKPNILMILDSSRSMWGQIDGINKVVSARTVIGGIAPKLEEEAQFRPGRIWPSANGRLPRRRACAAGWTQ